MKADIRWITLAAVAGSTLLSFGRTFNGWDWLVPSAAAVVLAAIASLALTRRLWKATAVLASCVIGAWFIVVVTDPSRTLLGLPTLAGIASAMDAGVSAWDLSKEAVAPIDALEGLLILLLAATWMASAISSVAAYTGHHLIATIPWIGMFSYASAVGLPEGRSASVLLFASALVAYLFVTSDSGQETPLAVRAGAIAVAGALIVTPLVPGYDSPPIVSLGPIVSAQGTRLAPFEFISAQLRDEETSIMFKVRADGAAYWRLAALDLYNGQTWSKGLDFGQKLPLKRPRGTDPETITVRQRYTIHGLRGQWVPGAFRTHLIDGIQALNDPLRDTVYTNALSSGTSYYAVSTVPNPSRSTMEQATISGQLQLVQRYRRLPQDLSVELAEIAASITKGAEGPYAKAVAIQEHLRSFRYSLDPPRIGHSESDLVRFLTKRKEGYCENFAGAMAVLLRTIGIPSRVAVGFLPGEEKSGTFTVTNKDAHAWVEAWFDEIGWVSFEPTPRSEATPPSYATAASIDPGGPVDPETVHPGRSEPAATPSPSPLALPSIEEPVASPDVARVAATRTGIAALLILMVLFLSKLLWMRLPYMRTSSNPVAAAHAAYRELETRGRDTFRAPRIDETETEFARAFSEKLSLDLNKIDRILEPHLSAVYSIGRVPDDCAIDAVVAMKSLRADFGRAAGPGGRLKMGVSPGVIIAAGRRLVGARRD